MTTSAPVQVFVADPAGAAVPIMADPGVAPFTAPPAKVTLNIDCAQLCPPGWPAPPDETGAPQVDLYYPRVIRSGTTITTFACIAIALVAAGAATPA